MEIVLAVRYSKRSVWPFAAGRHPDLALRRRDRPASGQAIAPDVDLEGHIAVCEPRSIPTYAVRAVRRSAGPAGEGIDQSVAGTGWGSGLASTGAGNCGSGVDASGRPKVAE